MLTSSGQAANFYAIMNIVEAGDHIVGVRLLFTEEPIICMLTRSVKWESKLLLWIRTAAKKN